MNIRKKLFILIIVAIFIYWPGIPVISLACHAVEIDENVCFTIGSLRISLPVNDGWEDAALDKEKDSMIDDTSGESLQTGETLVHASGIFGW